MRRARVVQFATVALVALAAGCSQDTSTVGPTTNDPLVAKLISLGYRGDKIEDRGDHFIVEGDIWMSKRDLQQLVDGERGLRPDFHYRTTNLVDTTQVQNINVSLAGISTQPVYLTAVRQAFVEWNKVNCSRVRFIEGGSPIRIRVVTYNQVSGTAATAKTPLAGGLPGDTVRINLQYNGPNNDAIRKRNMVHEFGHTIGFRHTNVKSDAPTSIGAIHIPGTPTDPPGDPSSVMNGGTAGTPWTSFSGYDNKATATLYPSANSANCLRPTISGPGQAMPYQLCTFTAAPNGGVAPYAYNWMGTGYVANGSVFRYSNSGSSYTVSVSIRDANGRVGAASKSVTVSQYSPC